MKVTKCSPTNNQMKQHIDSSYLKKAASDLTLLVNSALSLPELLFLQGMYAWSIGALIHLSVDYKSVDTP